MPFIGLLVRSEILKLVRCFDTFEKKIRISNDSSDASFENIQEY